MERVGRQCPEFSRRLAALLIDLTMLEVALAILRYFTLMGSSYKQATVGKLFLWMAVPNVKGGRMSFNKALLRNVGKYTSPLIVFEIGTPAASWAL